MTNMINYARRSLEGLWVGDCVGNLGTLYFTHDILKALEEGVAKFGGQLNQFHNQFQYSDDTEEAIVLYNHLVANNGKVDQDKLAMEFATRYMTRDPDGEIFGYGLSTRKVLRQIYEGVPWQTANKQVIRHEGVSSQVDNLVRALSEGKGYKETIDKIRADVVKEKEATPTAKKEGSCGNGSAMRVAPLGAFMRENNLVDIPKYAALQAQVTHDHPEGFAGAIAVACLSYIFTELAINPININADTLYEGLLMGVPKGQVYDGIVRARGISLDTPIGKVIQVLGNGSTVTCQDTVPLCCYVSIKHFLQDKADEMYEKAIIETSLAFGDVDTNCAIVGGIVGVVSPPPAKWSKFCKPMDGVLTPDGMEAPYWLPIGRENL